MNATEKEKKRMYRVVIGIKVKEYRRLGNAFNFFWKVFNSAPLSRLPNMAIYYLKTERLIVGYTQAGGFVF